VKGLKCVCACTVFKQKHPLSKFIGSATLNWCWTKIWLLRGNSLSCGLHVLIPPMLLLKKVMKLRMRVHTSCMCSFQIQITACRVCWQCYTLLRRVMKLCMHIHASIIEFCKVLEIPVETCTPILYYSSCLCTVMQQKLHKCTMESPTQLLYRCTEPISLHFSGAQPPKL